MTTWSRKRQFTYGLAVVAVLVALLVGVGYSLFYNPPSCSDGTQNGDETGVDCGGSCAAICPDTAVDPALRWSRSFAVVPGIYNAVAYIENANTNAVSNDVGYVFRLYDERNVLVAERRGSTRISRVGTVPIFEPSIGTGNRTVARTLFEFTEPFSWRSATDEAPTLTITQRMLTGEQTAPRLEARLKNTSLDDAFDVTVIAVVFNQEGNAIAASRTAVPLLEGGASESIVFTWPQPFPEPVAQIDIIPRLPSER